MENQSIAAENRAPQHLPMQLLPADFDVLVFLSSSLGAALNPIALGLMLAIAWVTRAAWAPLLVGAAFLTLGRLGLDPAQAPAQLVGELLTVGALVALARWTPIGARSPHARRAPRRGQS